MSIETTFENFIVFVLYAMLLNLTMSAQGYFCGVLSDSEEVAKQTNVFMILLFMLTSGGLGNAATFPSWINWLSYVSPQRYSCQGFFYRVSLQIPQPFQDITKKILGYDTYGDARCLWVLFAELLFFTVAAIFVINLRNRK